MAQNRPMPKGGNDDWHLLPEQIARAFTFAELRLLCFELNVNPQSLGESLTIEDRSVALIEYMRRRGRLPDLIAVLREQRPNIIWPDVPTTIIKPLPRISYSFDQYLRSRWLRLLIVIFGLGGLGAALIWQQRDKPVEPMGDGFNLAVAGFTVEGESPAAQEAADALSDWLYNTVVREVSPSFGSQKFIHRGPAEIGIVSGSSYAERSRMAKEVAYQHQATILIYGVVTENLPLFDVSLEFFVDDESFGYGSEIAGPDSLGLPVSFSLPLDAGTLTSVNEKLNGRREALQHIILGLRQFQIEEFPLALSEFEWVASDPGWTDEEGKEVIYLLLGATHLRLYEPTQPSEHLETAESYFIKARELNPAYSRNYLGLGAVALERAQIIEGADIVGVDPIRLIEAKGHYLTSLRPTAGGPYPYVTLKANLGLGAAHLLGYEFDIDGWSEQEAEERLELVISDYEIANKPNELAWFAANAHAQLGILASLRKDWNSMLAEHREAISILTSLERPPNAWIARYWSRIGVAYEGLDKPGQALDAYQKAISIGGVNISQDEFEEWEEKVAELTPLQ